MAPKRNVETKQSSSSKKTKPGPPEALSYRQLKEITQFSVKLGGGGSSQVYRGSYKDDVVAVKLIPDEKGNESGLEQWEAEKKYLSKFDHKNIVKLIGYGRDEGKLFLVLEHFPYKLDQRAINALDWPQTVNIIKQSANAMQYIHKKNLVMADFKPDNILLDEERIVKLIDFGAMIEAGERGFVYTEGYAAPEFYKLETVAADRWDIYSLGIVILQLMMKSETVGVPSHVKKPGKAKQRFDGKTHIRVMALRQFERDNNGVAHKNLQQAGRQGGMTIKLAKLALDCTELNPDNRPSISEVIERLKDIRS